MVKLLVGHKGSGKTKQMIEMANDDMVKSDGHIIFINKELMLSFFNKLTIIFTINYFRTIGNN